MKLAILGGGGFRVPLVYRALLGDTAARRVTEVALYDTAPERLDVITAVLGQQAVGHPDPPRVAATTELDDALGGADFVFAAIRVGGLAGRTKDERVALELGVLGQETTGPGGIAYGLRTVPVLLRIAERVKAVAPEAYFINFTNPAGLVTEALHSVLGDRVIGICDSPTGLARRVAGVAGAPNATVDYVGLNHLGWLRRVLVDGRDVLPELLADDRAVSTLEESRLFGADWLRTLGAVPNEYLYYYYCAKDAVRAILDRPATRGEFLLRQQSDFYDRAARDRSRALELWRATIAEREALYMAEARGGRPEERAENDREHANGYEGVALAVMAAIARDEPVEIILNVAGAGVPGLPADAVVEVPTRIDATGVRPHPSQRPVFRQPDFRQPDLHQLGLMQQVKAVERLTIEAATTGSTNAALKAFALHPLVGSLSTARELLRGYTAAHPELATILRG